VTELVLLTGLAAVSVATSIALCRWLRHCIRQPRQVVDRLVDGRVRSPAEIDQPIRGLIRREAWHVAATLVLMSCLASVGLVVALVRVAVAAEVGPVQVADGAGQTDRRHRMGSTNADPSWRPSARQIASVEAVTFDYFAARDAGRSEEAYALLSAVRKEQEPLSRFQARIREFNARAGQVRTRCVRAVTWYKDAADGGPGLYVAVDFSSEFANLPIHFGYLVWREQADGRFLQVREEENAVDPATIEKLGPDAVEKLRAQVQC
jgi:hypothetical protein